LSDTPPPDLSCANCSIYADEIARVRLLSKDYLDPRWRAVNVAVEYTRLWSPGRLYVHCERARGESDAEFAARYARVKAADERRFKAVTAERAAPSLDEIAIALPAPTRSLFDGRLETL
jgi:hypothetical protein